MNTIKLNTIGDSPVVVKKGSQVQSQEKTVEITENGTTEVVPDAGYALSKVTVNTNVESSGSATKWTGHADAEGLKAIGWTDEDIAYYQANGVNWNEEDDEYHKVTDDNKALYGVLTAGNISTYKDRIVYLPKIDTSGKTAMYRWFRECTSLVAIPQLDTSSVTNMDSTFQYCYSLVSIPPLDTSSVTNMNNMFDDCSSLVSIPQLDTSSAKSMDSMFKNCSSLVSIPQLDTSSVTDMGSMFYQCYSLTSIPALDTSSVTDMYSMFRGCSSLVSIPQLDTSSVTSMTYIFMNCYSIVSIPLLDTSSATSLADTIRSCYSLTYLNLKGVKFNVSIISVTKLSKDSLLYIINNEAATSAITITLAKYAYTRLAEDADVVAALANHPNISLASA